MRVLCVCNSGNVRSVTLGRLLKKRGAEVLCCGIDKAYKFDTVCMLVRWADIVYCQKDSQDKLVQMLHQQGLDRETLDDIKKIDTRFDVGPDDWKIPDHPDLHRRIRDMIMSDGLWRSSDGDHD